jgi:radical SAM-linked protein
MRICFSFARKMALSYLSHLDMLRLFLRALGRSGMPLAYSHGYNPHPRFTLALPLPLGVTAAEEFGEIFFTEEIAPDRFISLLQAQLPEALVLTGATVVDMQKPSIASHVGAALYRAVPRGDCLNGIDPATLRGALDSLMEKAEILARRKTKKNKFVYTDVRPYILELEAGKYEDGSLMLKLLLQAGSQGGVPPAYVIEHLKQETGFGCFHASDWHIHRERLFMKKDGVLQPLSERMGS